MTRVGLVVALLLGCQGGDWCDDDHVLERAACVPAAAESDASDAGGDAVEAESDEAGTNSNDAEPDGATDLLGAPCAEAADCGGRSSACVRLPGQETGYCAPHDCTPGGTDCPESYTCVDVSRFTDEYTSVCYQGGS